MSCGIYMIKNMINGKVYIGQAVNINKRWHEHISDLYANRHINKHLQRAWNKYGANNFRFNIVEECSEEELNDREIYYIAKYKAHNRKYGYNKTYGGDGLKATDEIRAKMSKSIKKAHANPAVQAKMSKSIKKAYANPVIHDKKSKLSKEDVLKIVELFVTKHYSMTKLGKMFNVYAAAIASIINNQTFHIYDNEINTVLAKYNLTREDLKGMKRKKVDGGNQRKLSKADVLNVIDLYLHGYSMGKIAVKYNMSLGTINKLINGETYKEYDTEINKLLIKYNLTRDDLKGRKRKAGGNGNNKKLSKADVLNVIDLYLHGHTQKEIAKMYNRSSVQIGRLINGDTYKEYNDEIQQMIDDFYGDNVKKA